MRVFPWIGSVILVAIIGTGGAVALRANSYGASLFTAARPAAAASPSSLAARQGPSQSLIPLSAKIAGALPPKKAAPVAPVAPRSAPPRIVIGSTQQSLINQDRARAGLKPLSWSSCLASIANSNAVRMATANKMWHTDGASRDLGCQLGSHAGENIGYWTGGINDVQLNTMFMNSPEHRANILSGYYHYVGTAWVVAANGTAYIAVEFS
jgi:uncharacterized protein YkwD